MRRAETTRHGSAGSRTRGLAIFLPVFVTLVLAGFVGGLIVVQHQQQNEQVAAADAEAEAFLAGVGRFEQAVAREIGGARTADPGGPVRARLIPAFVEARDRLAGVPVPDGQDRLATTVRDALQHVIDEATTLAVSIESNRAYSFTYSTQFQAATDAVDDYATVVNGDLTEAIDDVVGS